MQMKNHLPTDQLQYPSGPVILDELYKSNVKYVVALPDIVTSSGLLWPIARDDRFRLIRICKEDEGISICAAMSYNGTRAVLLMQQTGLMDSLNAIRAIGMDYQLPVIMIVGLQGKEPEVAPGDSKSYGVRIVIPVLQAMSISYNLIENTQDVMGMSEQIKSCYNESNPHIFLIGRSPTT